MVLRRGLGNRTNRIRQEIDLLFVLLFAWGGGSYPQRAEKNLVEFQPSCQLLVCAAHAVGGSTAPQDDTSQGWGILLFHVPCVSESSLMLTSAPLPYGELLQGENWRPRPSGDDGLIC